MSPPTWVGILGTVCTEPYRPGVTSLMWLQHWMLAQSKMAAQTSGPLFILWHRKRIGQMEGLLLPWGCLLTPTSCTTVLPGPRVQDSVTWPHLAKGKLVFAEEEGMRRCWEARAVPVAGRTVSSALQTSVCSKALLWFLTRIASSVQWCSKKMHFVVH